MKGAAPRPLAPPVYLCIGLSLISALIYALALRAPYPLAEGLGHPLASWGNPGRLFAARRPGTRMRLCAADGILHACAECGRASSTPQQQRALLILIVGGWLLSSAVPLGTYPGESLEIPLSFPWAKLRGCSGYQPACHPAGALCRSALLPVCELDNLCRHLWAAVGVCQRHSRGDGRRGRMRLPGEPGKLCAGLPAARDRAGRNSAAC